MASCGLGITLQVQNTSLTTFSLTATGQNLRATVGPITLLNWTLINVSQAGRNIKTNVKVKLRNDDPPENEEHLLEEWKDYFSPLLNNDSGFPSSDLPALARNDLPICTNPSTREETAEAIAAMKTNKAAGLDCAITTEALQWGGDLSIDTIHAFYSEVCTNMSLPKQQVSNVIIPLPKKGDPQRNHSSLNSCQGL